MDARTSKQRKSRKKKMNGGEDIISTLPDHILHQILSCLPTKYAVATSVLSTRWKYLWTSISNLDFVCSTQNVHSNFLERMTCFTNFVDRVLILHDTPSINKFSISCRDCDAFRFNLWVSKVITLHVRELILDFTIIHDPVVLLPSCLFSCESLAALKIIGEQIKIPTLISFPNLKIVHLESISFHRENMTQQVSFSCPILEKITLWNISWENINTIKFLTPQLKKFEVYDASDSGTLGLDVGEIEVYAEKLLSLELITPFASQYSLDDLSSLVDATIEMSDFDYEHTNDYVDLLRGVCKVKDLTLGFQSIGVLSRLDLSSHLLTFSSLTRLSVAFLSLMMIPEDTNGGKLINFLCNTANIESLSFPDGLHIYTFGKHGWTHGTNFNCFLPRLKVITFGRFNGAKNELFIVKFFVKHVRALEKLNIKLCRTKEEERKIIMEQLQKLVRGSNCVVEYT